jgi:cytosine/adenosine deaminase-related metal-dependent hydrolase
VIDLGDAVLLPGFANVHAHPELTGLRGSLEGLAFDAWLERLIDLKYERLRPEEVAAATRWGVAEAARAGVTSIGMIDDAGYGPDALDAIGLRGICYLELFGPDPAEADLAFARFRARFEELRDRMRASGSFGADSSERNSRVKLGISPHALYTVSAVLLKRSLSFAREGGLPVTIHAGESRAETEFVVRGRGPLADRLRRRDIDVTAAGPSPIARLAELGATGPDVLLAHCVQLDERDVELLAGGGAAVAHCPISNAKLGHGIAPIAWLVEHGARIGIGSDSVATNNRVDMLSEARTGALMQAASTGDPAWAAPERWIRMLTLGGAEALGLQTETGSLEPGKWADLVAVELTAPHLVPASEPCAALLFAAGVSDVKLTLVAGRPVYQSGREDEIFAAADRSLLRRAAERIRD